jgi:hypothetical protein
MTMSFVPFACHACDRCWLQLRAGIDHDGNAGCECTGIGRAISSDSYDASDVSLFAAIVDSLRLARLTPLNAGRLALELESREAPSPATKLARMSELVPSLCIIEVIATTQPETTRKAVAMFAAVLNVMAVKRSASDVEALLGPRRKQPRERT